MVETYKYKSKIATAIAFIAVIIVYLGKDGLAQIIPPEYAYTIPLIVFVAGWILAQTTENKRVDVAEQMILEKLGNENPITDVDPTAEYENEEYPVVGDDEDGC